MVGHDAECDSGLMTALRRRPPRMPLSRLAPDQRRFAQALDLFTGVQNPAMLRLVRTITRLQPGGTVPGVQRREETADGVPLRVFVPQAPAPRGALIWIHGGGLVLGSAKQDDVHCARTADQLGVVVVSVDYRLAPEHPFPAAIDDCTTAWTWLLEHADELGVDLDRLAIGGESAGGGLAACLVQRVHDRGGPQPVAQWLFAPMLDDRTAADTSLDAIDHFVWDNRANRFGWTSYLGQEPGRPHVPDHAVAPRRDDLSGLPPTWVYTSDAELFENEITDYARRLSQAGVETELVIVPDVPHAFELGERTPAARELMANAREWLRRALSA